MLFGDDDIRFVGCNKVTLLAQPVFFYAEEFGPSGSGFEGINTGKGPSV